MNSGLRRILAGSAGRIPVRARSGFCAGARWTAYPWTSYWRGTHEPEIQDAITGHAREGMVGWNCWDLGAHYGFYSVGLAMRVGPTGQVAAFEPNPESFSRLRLHREMNGLDWLKVYDSAVSDRTGHGELLAGGAHDSTESHLRYEDETEGGRQRTIGIRTTRLDDLVESGELRLPRFIKMDVEGHGHKALAGMQATLAKARPAMVIGLHSAFEVDGVLQILEPLGYSWEAIGASRDNPQSMNGGDYLFTARPG